MGLGKLQFKKEVISSLSNDKSYKVIGGGVTDVATCVSNCQTACNTVCLDCSFIPTGCPPPPQSTDPTCSAQSGHCPSLLGCGTIG